MKCLVCNQGETHPGKATITLERDGTKLTVQGVPAMVCSHCGDETVNAEAKANILKAVQEATTEDA